jgi:antitoxin (DNA-binding transcriptional repressor) of toxin-antitoxin stability system
MDEQSMSTGPTVSRVTVRQMARRMGEVLDHVASGRSFVLYRFGRPLAFITPVVEGFGIDGGNRLESLEPTEEDLAAVPTYALQRRILRDFCERRVRADDYVSEGVGLIEAGIALTRLEVAGLARKTIGGYQPTPQGTRVVRALEVSEQKDAEEPGA